MADPGESAESDKPNLPLPDTSFTTSKKQPAWIFLAQAVVIFAMFALLHIRVQYGRAGIYETRFYSIAIWPALAYAWYQVQQLVHRRFSFSKDADLPLAIVLTILTVGGAHWLVPDRGTAHTTPQ